MHTLPVELITRIAFLACTDGGLTACSLSLVCRFFRAAARPARFHTVAFDGPSLHPLRTFLSVYREEQTDDPISYPKVHHLFISTFPLKGGQLTPNLHAPEAYASEVSTLLDVVAPTLETLACIGFRRSIPDLATLGIIFPALEELTICDIPNPFPLDLHVHDVSRPFFPALRRLHKWNRSIEPRWAAYAPGLTHIRLSELNPIDFPFGPIPSDDTYPSLNQVIVQPRLPYGIITSRVIKISWKPRSEAHTSVTVYIVPVEEGSQRSTAMFKRCCRITRRQWLARVEGHPGCWALPATDIDDEDLSSAPESLGWTAAS
ncbi:hypothetical protein L226DRAFT_566986 [Lentinus tigrinus ALCF2SS1-7]|uniref:F-box domain-containing protein n=1 Tax=Lentinus tigrinus ALCF2SS1-6 TaxID=1328759 RepID=A0A5C2ST05_9APHY|nr:hypothetical protein L227DRAFT_606649 [Lentinus tigrinus ALCF2SS1-6]RPD80513.1 hypothetical protein L226DRAFT_566986 [Lentinus tigrinus ALCF2SS1-7]